MKKIITKQKILLVPVLMIFLMFPHLAKGQQSQVIGNVIPPSPEAASLAKYGEYPVSLYTGVPNITVPIWQIKTNKLSLPVQLSYHASGIKVDEVASNVGLGWSLNAGGVITRTVRGLPDDHQFGFYKEPVTEDDVTDVEAIKKIVMKGKDGEADIFYFNVGGIASGSFFFSNDNPPKVVLTSKQQVDIHVEPDFSEFVLTTADGTKYYFGELGLAPGSEYTEVSWSRYENMPPDENISSWYLRKIESFDNTDEITFHYQKTENTPKQLIYNETVRLSPNTMQVMEVPEIGKTRYWTETAVRLDYIEFDHGKIDFEYLNNRVDFSGQSLDKISIKNGSDTEIKRFELAHSYFSSEGCNANYCKRLRLDAVTEHDADGNSKPPYLFDYYEGHNLPSRESYHSSYFSQDHWGYYNEASNGNSLVPETEFNGMEFPGADRNAKWPAAKANTLERITYPIGGSTDFVFEPNYLGMNGPNTIDGYFEDRTIIKDKLHADDDQYSTESFDITIHNESHNQLSVKLSITRPIGLENKPFMVVTFSGRSTGETFGLTLAMDLDDGESMAESLFKQAKPDVYDVEVLYRRQGTFICKVNYEEFIDEVTVVQENFTQVGGLRIAQIINHPGDGQPDMTKTYQYTYKGQEAPEYSTGSLVTSPTYQRWTTKRISMWDPKPENGSWIERTLNMKSTNAWTIYDYGLIELTSQSYLPLGTTQGGIVGYHQVMEVQDNGVKRYTYTITAENSPDPATYYKSDYQGVVFSEQPAFSYPYPPIVQPDWALGQVKEIIQYNQDDQIVMEEYFNYYDQEDEFGTHLSIKVAPQCVDGDCSGTLSEYVNTIAKYFNLSGVKRLKSKNSIVYDKVGQNPVQTFTEYFYDNDQHLQQTRIMVFTGQPDKYRVTNVTYPQDYADESGFIGDMKSKHIFSPIETVIYETDYAGNTVNILSGKFNSYKPGLEAGLLYHTYVLRTNSPIPLSGFKFSNATSYTLPQNDNFDKIFVGDSRYDLAATFTNYENGNIAGFKKKDDISTSIVWGYNYTRPVAKVTGVDYASVSSAINLENIQNLDGNNLRTALGGLRTSFPTALITTYTYDPLYGMTSSTDENGYTTKYIYDGFGRLKTVKDNEDHIIKEVQYDYANFYRVSMNITGLGDIALNDGTEISSGQILRYRHGEELGFDITPDPGYYIEDILINGISQGNITSYTSNVEQNLDVEVRFKIYTYTITGTVYTEGVPSTVGGTISPSDPITVDYNKSQNFTFPTNDYYHLEDLKLDGVSVFDEISNGSYTLFSIQSDRAIDAYFVKTMVDGYVRDENGNGIEGVQVSFHYIGPPPDRNNILEASPFTDANGYFSFWKMTDNFYSEVIAEKNHWTFQRIGSTYDFTGQAVDYTLSLTKAGNGTGTLNKPTISTIHYGDELTLLATPDISSIFISWSGDYTSTQNPFTIAPVTGDINIAATFTLKKVELTTSVYTEGNLSTEGGTASPSGTINVNYGSTPSYTLTPNVGYIVSDFRVNGISRTNRTLDPVTSNHSVSVYFEKDFFEGYVRDENGNGIEGVELTFYYMDLDHNEVSDGTATTDANGYYQKWKTTDRVYIEIIAEKSHWTFQRVGTSNDFTGQAVDYTLSLTKDGNGTGTLNKPATSTIHYGDELTLSATPDISSIFSRWSGDYSSTQNPFTITNNRGDLNIVATFTKKYFTVSTAVYTEGVLSTTGGTLSPSGNVNVNYGDDAVFNINTNIGYIVSDAKVDGVSLTQNLNIVPSVTSNKAYAVYFDKKMIKGYVRDANGNGIEGVSIRYFYIAHGEEITVGGVTTNSSGYYSIWKQDTYAYQYELTKQYWTFAPGTGNDFIGTYQTPSINLSVSSITTTDHDYYSQNITVTANRPWTVSDNKTWISVSPASGTNNGSFRIDLESNCNTSPRTGTVTVTGSGVTKTISIYQREMTCPPDHTIVNCLCKPVKPTGK